MHVEANGTRLRFDVEGAALVPDGSAMRERPTVVLLDGGPGSPERFPRGHDGVSHERGAPTEAK